MSDYERITSAFEMAGLGFNVVRNDEYWKAISIDSSCAKSELPEGYDIEYWFKPDGAFVSTNIDF